MAAEKKAAQPAKKADSKQADGGEQVVPAPADSPVNAANVQSSEDEEAQR